MTIISPTSPKLIIAKIYLKGSSTAPNAAAPMEAAINKHRKNNIIYTLFLRFFHSRKTS